jgi:hypothetical protein
MLSPRLLYIRTGVHTVADVFCLGCDDRLGWYYHTAQENTQKYKEGVHCTCNMIDSADRDLLSGKYLLEREKLVKENAWKLDD